MTSFSKKLVLAEDAARQGRWPATNGYVLSIKPSASAITNQATRSMK
jgi:hypothetical protein